MGHVLDDIVTDGRDMMFSWFWILDSVLLSYIQGQFERYSRDVSATRRNIAHYCPKGVDEIKQAF